MLLDGKTALVTGGSRGIGREIALQLAKEGAGVAVNYSGNESAAEETARMIREFGGKAMIVRADVSDFEAAERMVKEVADAYGRIDILINNAGITRDNLLLRMKEADWDAVLNTNLKGVFNCTKAVTKIMMKQRSGKIVNMTSVIGLSGNAGQANYAAAKAGVIGFTKSMAKELANRGICVNAVAPGFIDTDMTANLPEQMKDDALKKIPLAKLGSPGDVAGAVMFLVSDAASYITGQTLNVDGGMVM